MAEEKKKKGKSPSKKGASKKQTKTTKKAVKETKTKKKKPEKLSNEEIQVLQASLADEQRQYTEIDNAEKLVASHKKAQKDINTEIKGFQDETKKLNALLDKSDYASFEKHLSENELGNVKDLQNEIDAAVKKYENEIEAEAVKALDGKKNAGKAIELCNSKIDDLNSQVFALEDKKFKVKTQEERAKIQEQIDKYNEDIRTLEIERGEHSKQKVNYSNELKRLDAAAENSIKNIATKTDELEATKARFVERAKLNIQKDIEKLSLKEIDAKSRLDALKESEKEKDYIDAQNICLNTNRSKSKHEKNIKKISEKLGIEPHYSLEEPKKEEQKSKDSKETELKAEKEKTAPSKDKTATAQAVKEEVKEESKKEEVASVTPDVKNQNDSKPVKTAEELDENIEKLNAELDPALEKIASEESKEEVKEESKKERRYIGVASRVIKVARHPLMTLGYVRDRATGKIPVSVTVTEYIDKKIEDKGKKIEVENKEDYTKLNENLDSILSPEKVEEEVKEEVEEAKDSVTKDDVNAMESTTLEESNKDESLGLPNTFTYNVDSQNGPEKEETVPSVEPEAPTTEKETNLSPKEIRAKLDEGLESYKHTYYQAVGAVNQLDDIVKKYDTAKAIETSAKEQVSILGKQIASLYKALEQVLEKNGHKTTLLSDNVVADLHNQELENTKTM